MPARTHIRRCAAALATGAAISMASYGELSADPRMVNPSSHSAEFFRSLLTGRVLVYLTSTGRAGATYFGADGSWPTCFPGRGHSYVSYPRSTWKIVTSPRTGKATLELATPWRGKNAISRSIMIYDGATGAIHTEGYSGETGTWRAHQSGWVQDKWPSALGNACAGVVDLPWSLGRDRSQNSLRGEHMKANATPVVRHPGWEYNAPGATGLGASGGQPTMTIAEVKAVPQQLHGRISARLPRGRVVVVDHRDHWEIWRIDRNNDIVDVAMSRLTGDGSVIENVWDSGRRSRILVGYPLGILPTPTLHPAFAMMQDLSAAGSRVALAGKGDYVFARDGAVSRSGSEGKWWLSRGAVHVEIDGQTTRMPWRAFARQAGWSPSSGN